jgi:hypothetical protein
MLSGMPPKQPPEVDGDGPRPVSVAASTRPGRRLVLAALASGVTANVARAAPSAADRPVSVAERSGSLFLPAPASSLAAPVVQEVPLPDLPGAQSIWGATGRDLRGGLWFGVSVRRGREGAVLLQLDPRDDRWRVRGNVVDQLRRARALRDGEGQAKIHSRIVTGADGYLYFASMDEDGEREDGSALPRWGGHLWRLGPGDEQWEHLFAAPEALIATAAGGRNVFALGYWDHVLYAFDTASARVRKVRVGSVGGHVSRNLLATLDGHAFVPRVRRAADGRITASLVEFDGELREVGSFELPEYAGRGSPESHHGITGLAQLPDGRVAFTTARGRLHLIVPSPGAAARVEDAGWFHPDGEAYAPSLFAYGGSNLLAGVVQRPGRFEWVIHELLTRTSVALPLDTRGLRGVLLYGSVTRDARGRCYLVGWATDARGSQRPLLLRVAPG